MKKTVIVLCLLVALIAAGHWWVTRPELYKSCSSTGDGLVLKVHRSIAFPYIEGVDVTATVEAADGRQMYRKVIAYEDLWSDVDEKFPNVRCEDDRFVIGPGYWDGTRTTDFVLLKTEIGSQK